MTFIAALILGLLASMHCAGMCGGLQAALQQPTVIRSNRQALQHLLVMNGGRLITYISMGVIFSSMGAMIITNIDIPQITKAARYFSAVMMILIGLQILISSKRPFMWAERLGAKLWRVVSKNMSNDKSIKLSGSLQRGIVWGFLPCGLVYAVLVTTLFSNNPINGAVTMIGFGVGTLPAMILTGGVYQSFRSVVKNKGVQFFGGLIFIQSGLLILLAPLLINMDFLHNYPQLMTSIFCVS